ncbi:MAG: asparaginase [Vampirovibrio sp.]|nr:asparaginase [Vampirovibrio sp.]
MLIRFSANLAQQSIPAAQPYSVQPNPGRQNVESSKSVSKSTLDGVQALVHNTKPMAAAYRGDQHPEVLFLGSAVITDNSGHVLNKFGSPHHVIKTRSSIKPLHAALLYKLLKERGQENLLTPPEWAVLSSSHAGTPKHIKYLTSAMKKLGVRESELICKTDHPTDKQADADIRSRWWKLPRPIHHQCAGHHTVLTAISRLIGANPTDYWKIDGKLQQYCLEKLTSNQPGQPEKIKLVKYDGCNIPTVSLPLDQYAITWANFAANPMNHTIINAMSTHPDLIGDKSRIDGQLMNVTNGRLIAKFGSDGNLCVANPHKKQAMVLKNWNGSDSVNGLTVIEALAQVKWLTPPEVKILRDMPQFQLVQKNHRGELVRTVKVDAHLWDQ